MVPSSQTTRPPRGLSARLSGMLSTGAPGDSKSSRIQIAPRIDLPDLSHLRVATVGCRYVDSSVTENRSFQAREDCATAIEALLEYAHCRPRRGAGVRPSGSCDVDPVDVVASPGALPAVVSNATASVDRQHLQFSTLRQLAASQSERNGRRPPAPDPVSGRRCPSADRSATASWTKHPMPLIGFASDPPSCGTSKT